MADTTSLMIVDPVTGKWIANPNYKAPQSTYIGGGGSYTGGVYGNMPINTNWMGNAADQTYATGIGGVGGANSQPYNSSAIDNLNTVQVTGVGGAGPDPNQPRASNPNTIGGDMSFGPSDATVTTDFADGGAKTTTPGGGEEAAKTTYTSEDGSRASTDPRIIDTPFPGLAPAGGGYDPASTPNPFFNNQNTPENPSPAERKEGTPNIPTTQPSTFGKAGESGGQGLTASPAAANWSQFDTSMKAFNDALAGNAPGQQAFDAQLGEVDKGLAAQQASNQSAESTMARRAATEAALRGGSSSGGLSQAGAAQAAIGGMQLNNQAIADASKQRTAIMQNRVQYNLDIAGKQETLAQQALANATTSQDKDRANQVLLQVEKYKSQMDALAALLNNPTFTPDPATIAELQTKGFIPG